MQLAAGFAGTERHAVELANALAADHEVGLLIRARPPEPHRHPQYDAMRRAVAPAVRVFTASRALPVPALWLALLRFRPDIVHAHYERSARIAGRWSFGVPVLATIHAHWRERDYGRCDGLVCLTAEQAREVPEYYPGTRFVIGGWVLPPPSAPANLETLRAELGLSRGEGFIVGTACRLEEGKGVAELLAVFHEAGLPDARLIIAGDGNERPKLEALARRLGLGGRVIFAGFRDGIRDLYGLFDVFVLNSTDESYGLVILEAAAAGVPVISTATRGACAIAARHPLRLVPIGDTGALAMALREAKANRAVPPPPLSGFGIADRLPLILEAYRSVRQSRSLRDRRRRASVRWSWRHARSESRR